MNDLEMVKEFCTMRLYLKELLNSFERKQYLKIITNYITDPHHPISGADAVCESVEELVTLLEAFGLDKMDIAAIVVNEPALIFMSKQDIYYKYLMLGVAPSLGYIEDKRKEYIVNRPKDLRTSLNLVYARFSLMMELGYHQITWPTLLHISETQFAQKFVVNNGQSDEHRIFASLNDISTKELLQRYPIVRADMAYLKEFEANKEIVERYEGAVPKF